MRPGRNHLLGALLLCAGCSRGENAPSPGDTPPREPPPYRATDAQRPQAGAKQLEEEFELLKEDAGIETADPAAPIDWKHDWKHEIESFSTLEACVAAHALKDPLLQDAIDGLGYDALTRDACRTIDALQSKDVARCAPISVTALRTRCQTAVATLAGNPTLCPVVAFGASSRDSARDPVCLARASRDERLCEAALPTERPSCVALARGDASKCGKDTICARQVARFQSLLAPAHASAPLPEAHLRVEVHGSAGTPDPSVTTFDLADIAGAGAVVHRGLTGTRLSIGSPKSPLWPSWDAPFAAPRVWLELSLSPRELKDASVSLGVQHATFDLLLPKVASLSSLTASEGNVAIAEVGTQVGQPIKLKLTAVVGDAPRTYALELDLTTFVRDVVGP